MTRALLAAALGLLIALAASGPAHASNIKVEMTYPTCSGGDECRYFTEQPYATVTLEGAPGEKNVVTAKHDAGTVTYRDDGAPIADAAGCQRLAANEVRCIARYAYVHAGDGDDEVITDRAGALGGDGDDTLTGGDYPDSLNGGAGRDTLRGGGGSDSLHDGHRGAVGDDDVFDGGTGGASISYLDSGVAVRVDLSNTAAGAGEQGEGDQLLNVDEAQGGEGNDVLIAAPEGSALYGGEGNDQLIGGAGVDDLAGEEGRNVVSAGAGADKILGANVRKASRQRISCGDGPDVVTTPSGRDLVGGDCESIEAFTFEDSMIHQHTPLRSLAGRILSVPGFECFDSGRPRIALRVSAAWRRAGLPRAGTLLARRVASRRVCRGRPELGIKLSARGRRLLRRYRSLPVEVTIVDPGDRVSYTMELKAPGA